MIKTLTAQTVSTKTLGFELFELGFDSYVSELTQTLRPFGELTHHGPDFSRATPVNIVHQPNNDGNVHNIALSSANKQPLLESSIFFSGTNI